MKHIRKWSQISENLDSGGVNYKTFYALFGWSTMSSPARIAAVVLLSALLRSTSAQCPSQCICISSSVYCINAGLQEVPSDLPPGTTQL